ncbi:MAG: NAD(P)H-dependent oxidoreductase subunit E [Alphaproteobacteria bacterium]
MTTIPAKRFVFSKEAAEKVAQIQKKYPMDHKQAALLEVLILAQEQNQGWLSVPILEHVSQILDVSFVKIWEVVTFHTMFHTKPVGTFCVQVCTTTPCGLRGSSQVMRACQRWLGIKADQTTVDGMFTLKEVDCLGACANAPVMRVNEDYYEDLDEGTTLEVLEALVDKKKKLVKGSQKGRKSSEGQDA